MFSYQYSSLLKVAHTIYRDFFSAVKTENFNGKNDIFIITAQIIQAVLTSTNNLWFGTKMRKKVYLSKLQFIYINVGYKGVYITYIFILSVECSLGLVMV